LRLVGFNTPRQSSLDVLRSASSVRRQRRGCANWSRRGD
jgi:hypothetical protein